MKTKLCVRVTRASTATVMACVALLCAPAVTIAAAPRDSSAQAERHAEALLARGAGYGQLRGDPDVRALQRRLRRLGERPGPVDGLFGPLTEAAVRRVQRESGLSVDGVVGARTRRVLYAGSGERVRRASDTRRESGPQDQAPAARATKAHTKVADSTSPVWLILLGLAVAVGAFGLARWLRARRQRPAAAGRRSQAVAVDGPEQAGEAGPGRPGIGDALPRPEGGEESFLVVAELERRSRSAPEAGHIVESPRRRETRPVAVGDGLDTDAPASQRATEWPNNGSPPDLRRRIRAMRERGMTLQSIADQLNANKVPTLRVGAEWRPSMVEAATAGGSSGKSRRSASRRRKRGPV
jgi:hypothetical protein